jgi:hypothetical protein
MIKDEYITNLVKRALSETRERKVDGSRGKFQEVNGFVFFIDIRNSTQTFLEQQDRTYLKFTHAFYGGVHRIFKAYKFREDSIKFLGDGVLGVYRENLNKESIDFPVYEVATKIVFLVKEIIENLGARDNDIIDGIRISVVPTNHYKLYKGMTGIYGDSRVEYNGLAINQAVSLTKIKYPNEPFAVMRMMDYHYSNIEYKKLKDEVYEYEL